MKIKVGGAIIAKMLAKIEFVKGVKKAPNGNRVRILYR
jgi:hypothetical protein